MDRFLGEGAFAEVYRVKHKFLGRQAMKVFKSTGLKLQEIKRDLTEAVLLSKIGHYNIIRVFDAGILESSIGQRGYFTMEYVPGGTLESFWHSHKNGFIPISDTINIIRQICMGLAVGHNKTPPIIHRDIKPQNILVGYDIDGLRIKVSDFGLAKTTNPLTMLASAKGTPAFKPPECVQNIDSSAGDVWATGVTLYLLLTDQLPYPIESRMDLTIGSWWKHKLVPPGELNPRVDDFLESIVIRSLKLDPVERYPTANEMLEDLMRWKPYVHNQSKEVGQILQGDKNALGKSSGFVGSEPGKLVKEAMELSRDTNKLMEAADLLEEAITRQSELRDKYEYRLKLWRRGIAT
ncbi:serine/threonine-protein kinase [Chloroflexota bacterium]